MRGLLRPLIMGVAISLLFFVPQAGAVEGMIFDWAPESYGWETDYDLATHLSANGSQLTVVGVIDQFYDPFLDLDPATTEYSFIFSGLVSAGSIDFGGIVQTNYAGGTFEIYADPAMNADFGVNPPNTASPATFTDGDLILEGFLSNFTIMMFAGPGGWSGTYSADFEFTGPVGGEYYLRVEACYGTTGGGITDDNTLAGFPAGYTYQVDGHFTVDDCRPTGTEESNWGALKQLFR